MVLFKSLSRPKVSLLVALNCNRSIQTSAIRVIDMKWREERGLHKNPNAYGPLTNLPDYTFMDGRPTPLGSNQKKRLLRQRELANRIIALTNEMDVAKKRHQQLKEEEERVKKNIIDNKLKEKGPLLLKK